MAPLLFGISRCFIAYSLKIVSEVKNIYTFHAKQSWRSYPLMWCFQVLSCYQKWIQICNFWRKCFDKYQFRNIRLFADNLVIENRKQFHYCKQSYLKNEISRLIAKYSWVITKLDTAGFKVPYYVFSYPVMIW